MSRQTVKNVQIGQMASINSTEATLPEDVNATHRRRAELHIANSTVAASPVTETVIANPQRKGRVLAFTVVPPIAITANDTNYATISLSRKTGSGAAVNIAVANTQVAGGANALTALVPSAIALTANSVDFAANDVLFVAVTKTSNGVALTANTSAIAFCVDYEET